MKQVRRCISNKAWMKRHVDDFYVKEATLAGLRSRSAFKLQEIQEKHKILGKNDVVLDLGASVCKLDCVYHHSTHTCNYFVSFVLWYVH